MDFISFDQFKNNLKVNLCQLSSCRVTRSLMLLFGLRVSHLVLLLGLLFASMGLAPSALAQIFTDDILDLDADTAAAPTKLNFNIQLSVKKGSYA